MSGRATLMLWGVPLPGEVAKDDDLAELIARAEPGLADGDIVVVTSKVVSKAEGRLVPAPTDPVAKEAVRRSWVAAETHRDVAARGPLRIVATRHGVVLAAAGVDASNTTANTLALLPVDPDGSAARLRDGLRARLDVDVAVLISDTAGRPWRQGLVDIAIGSAGIAPLRDYRGRVDAFGNELAVTEMADIDALAAAAELVKGKLAGTPVAVIRGFSFDSSTLGARALVRPAELDLFPLGTAEARALGRADVARALDRLTDAPSAAVRVRRGDDSAVEVSWDTGHGYDGGLAVAREVAAVAAAGGGDARVERPSDTVAVVVPVSVAGREGHGGVSGDGGPGSRGGAPGADD